MRNDRGHFVKGESGNPHVRPRVILGVRDLARQHTEAAIETLASIMVDSEAPAAARISAASEILNRGFGRPVDQRVLLAMSAQIDRPMNARDLSTRDIIDLIVERSPGLLE